MPGGKGKKMSKKKKQPANKGPDTAMVLAAGLGLRMRPITDKIPKPMIEVGNRTLIDRVLDRLEEAGVKHVVVNLHHLAQLVEQHLKHRGSPDIEFSHEEERLETGGGVAKALPMLGNKPFYVVNSDTMWLNGLQNALDRMADLWDEDRMDGLLMLHSTVDAYGYRGDGDFNVDAMGLLTRRVECEVSPYLFTGVQILHPRLLAGTKAESFSLNVLYDKAIETERLYGMVHDGEWFHIGTPEGLDEAEAYMGVRYPGIKHR